MLRQNLDDFDAHGQKGDWCFLNDDHLIAIQWGDDHFTGTCILRINWPNPPNDGGGPSWAWDGNKEAPTLSPSIRCFTGDQTLWHGYLRAGKLETC